MPELKGFPTVIAEENPVPIYNEGTYLQECSRCGWTRFSDVHGIGGSGTIHMCVINDNHVIVVWL